MNHRLLGVLAAWAISLWAISLWAISLSAITLWPAAVSAQANRQPHYVTPPLRDDEQIMPSQVLEPPPAAKPKPKPAAAKPKPADDQSLLDPDAKAPPANPEAPPKPKPAEPARTIACSAGAF